MLGLGSWFKDFSELSIESSTESSRDKEEQKDKKANIKRRACDQVVQVSGRTKRANVSADFGEMEIGDMGIVFKRSKPSNNPCEDESTKKSSDKKTSKRSRGMWGEVGREPEDDGCVIC